MNAKKFLFLFIVWISAHILVLAQSPGPKWEKVLELSERTIYIDTSSVRQYENQISVLSIAVYKQPQPITSLNKEATIIKSQILFNAATKKFTVIGTLYYDKNLKILGETSLPGFASNSETFSVAIEGNEAMTVVFNKSVDYLKRETPVIEQKDFSKSGEKNKKFVTTDKKDKPKVDSLKPTVKDTSKSVDRIALYLSKKDSVQKAASQTAQTEPVQAKYSEENETNPKSTIFTDGSKYSFQVSSWKNKMKADSEVRRLKGEGHNAFVTEGYVKGITWYRVRIGYFNSLEETEEYMKKMR
ncbi:MAG: SPOR domain-containing protein [Bacteroidota bacterium]